MCFYWSCEHAKSCSSVLLLILVFGNISGILLILRIEFLALVYLVVYVGAIAVLFLFVIMMLDIRVVELSPFTFNYFGLSTLLLCLFAIELALIFSKFKGHIYMHYDLIDPTGNINVLGEYLFTFGAIPFILAGFVLLIAMLGAILLTLHHNDLTKRQSILKQEARQLTTTILVK